MAYTSLKLEESAEYHREQDKREGRHAKIRARAVIAVSVILVPAIIAGLMYYGDTLERDSPLRKAIVSGLATALLVLMIGAFKLLGLFGGHLKRKLLSRKQRVKRL